METKCRPVVYFGQHLYVPVWARWLATDSNGNIYAYTSPPTAKRTGQFTGFWASEKQCAFVAVSIKLDAADEWFFSCVRITTLENTK